MAQSRYTRPPFFSRIEFGWEFPILPVQEASELTCTTMHGFCYQLIRVEASGSRDQAVALVRRPTAGLDLQDRLGAGRAGDGSRYTGHDRTLRRVPLNDT